MRKTTTGCHNCPYDGKRNRACLSCDILQEQYQYKYQRYILPTYDAPYVEPEPQEMATSLSEDTEDSLRLMLYEIFDLDFSELLLLKAIMNNMSLTEFSNEFNKFIQYNTSKKCQMTRFCAFQIRKRMLSKLGKLALLTKGQKKQLKPMKRSTKLDSCKRPPSLEIPRKTEI